LEGSGIRKISDAEMRRRNGYLSLLGVKLAGLKARNLENGINESFGSCSKSEYINGGIYNGRC
jgi:hypothetical protein